MDHDKQTPPAAQDTDLSKAQNQQQPAGQQNQAELGQSQQPPQSGQQTQSEFGQSQEQPSGQADYGSAGDLVGQSDTTTQQRSDIEGGTSTGQATDVEGSSTFVGAKGATDTSSELIEDDESSDSANDGQGAPE